MEEPNLNQEKRKRKEIKNCKGHETLFDNSTRMRRTKRTKNKTIVEYNKNVFIYYLPLYRLIVNKFLEYLLIYISSTLKSI